MSKVAELYYDIQEMYIEGASANRIAILLDCPLSIVLEVLKDMGVEDVAETPQEEFDPFQTVNS